MLLSLNLAELNALSRAEFIDTLADIFEHSPWVADAVADMRPFHSVHTLHDAMVEAVSSAPESRQLSLLRAHPQLAGREAHCGELTSASTQEQASVGLNALDSKELERVAEYNRAYLDKFGFPFIIAVRNFSKQQILDFWQARLLHELATEFSAALAQVYDIAELRLEQRLGA
jgi:2-oxo-4-hydroxy-4-carboxy-5-ureidoimidazoline decarboxylase